MQKYKSTYYNVDWIYSWREIDFNNQSCSSGLVISLQADKYGDSPPPLHASYSASNVALFCIRVLLIWAKISKEWGDTTSLLTPPQDIDNHQFHHIRILSSICKVRPAYNPWRQPSCYVGCYCKSFATALSGDVLDTEMFPLQRVRDIQN